MTRLLNAALGHLICLLYNHPPVTSFAWNGRVENTAERTTNLAAMKGMSITVNCVCGAKMVSPIWRPWWRRNGR